MSSRNSATGDVKKYIHCTAKLFTKQIQNSFLFSQQALTLRHCLLHDSLLVNYIELSFIKIYLIELYLMRINKLFTDTVKFHQHINRSNVVFTYFYEVKFTFHSKWGLSLLSIGQQGYYFEETKRCQFWQNGWNFLSYQSPLTNQMVENSLAIASLWLMALFCRRKTKYKKNRTKE